MMRTLLLCGVLLTGGAAFAQQTTPGQDELLALNFYVQQNDPTAVEAELRRLRLKYPGWQPPADLGRLAVTAPSTEIDEIYRQIAAGNFDKARATLETSQAQFPDWTPPPEMLNLLQTAEGQQRFDAALAAGNLGQAISIASDAPGLLRCDRINNAWRIADGQAAAGRKTDALATYRAVANACVVPGDLLSTLEKADTVASEADILAMIEQTGQRLPAMQTDLAALRQRLLAGRGHAEASAALAPTGTGKAAAPAAGQTAGQTGGQAAGQTAGQTAAPAPKAEAKAPAAAAANSAANSGANSAGRSGGGSGGAGGSGFQAAVNAGDWARCLALSVGARAAAVIYQRGWCAYNMNQPMEAVTSFRSAMKGGLDATQSRDARYGLALAYLKMQMTEEASRVAAASDFSHKQRLDIERQILDQRGVAAYNRKQYRKAIAYLDALEQLNGGLRRDLDILRAFAWQNSGNPTRARQEFLRLNADISTNETRRALRIGGD